MITSEQAQELLEGTTPAPWELHPSKYVSGNYVTSAEGRQTLVHATEPWAGPADSKLIAAAPDLAATVIELSEELDRIRGHVEEIEYTFSHWHDTARDEVGSALFHIRFGPNPIRLDPDPEEP